MTYLFLFSYRFGERTRESQVGRDNPDKQVGRMRMVKSGRMDYLRLSDELLV